MKNKTLAIFGIGTYILSVLSSVTDIKGNSIAPIALILISGIAMVAFIVVATVRLWKMTKNLSIALAFSAFALFVLIVIQEFALPLYGSPIIILLNTIKVINFVVFIWVIIKLFKSKE